MVMEDRTCVTTLARARSDVNSSSTRTLCICCSAGAPKLFNALTWHSQPEEHRADAALHRREPTEQSMLEPGVCNTQFATTRLHTS